MQAYASIPTQKILNTLAPSKDALGDTEPMDETKNLRFPTEPHSDLRAFIGAGYSFFCKKPATPSRFPVNWVEHNAKYASRTGAVPNLSSPSMLSMIV